MNQINILILKHRLLLERFLKTSKEIETLDADSDFELLNQILSSRENQSKILFALFQEIEKLRHSVSSELFLQLIKENDELLRKILEIDSKNEKRIIDQKNEVELHLNSISNKKNVINNYHMNKIELPKFISKI